MLPDKFARFLFEFHSVRFESLNLPPLPADRSNFDVHGALEDDKVKTKECYALFVRDYMIRIMSLICIISIILGFYFRFVNVVLYVTS